MIDPREFGKLEAEVAALNKRVASMEEKIDQLVTLASEGKGGIRALWFAGSVVAGVLGWFGADKIAK
jgi:hypothetical protein